MFKWSNMSWTARAGLIGLIFFLLFAYVGPFLSPYSAEEVVGATWEPASEKMLLGADPKKDFADKTAEVRLN